MTSKITRRDWLVGGAAVAGGLLTSNITTAQTVKAINTAPTADNMIRCGSNENVYGPSIKAQAAMNDAASRAHLYGYPAIAGFKEVISKIENIPIDHISLASGSSPFLEKAALLAKIDGGATLAPDPTYDIVITTGNAIGAKIITVPVGEDMHIDLNAMRKAMTDEVKLVYLCNPNNPLPTIIKKNELRDFCIEMSKKATVLIDEAYYEYVDDPDFSTMAELVKDHKNIIVTRTASKIHAMAGIRVGMAFAHPDTLHRLAPNYNLTMNYMALKGATISYQDIEYQNFIKQKNKESMEILYAMFDDLDLPYIKSHTNFTFFKAGRNPADVQTHLRQFGIISGRPFPPYLDWIRLSTVKPEEMQYVADIYRREYG